LGAADRCLLCWTVKLEAWSDGFMATIVVVGTTLGVELRAERRGSQDLCSSMICAKNYEINYIYI
jgi:hypothetical protein